MCCFFPIPEPYSCFTPVLALSPSKGWTTLFFPFPSYPCSSHVPFIRLPIPFFHSCSCSVTFKRLDNPSFPASQRSPILTDLPYSCPCHLTRGWTPQNSTFVSNPFIQTTCYTTSCLAPFLAILLNPSYSGPCCLNEKQARQPIPSCLLILLSLPWPSVSCETFFFLLNLHPISYHCYPARHHTTISPTFQCFFMS